MDHIGILRRAAIIVWRNPALWLLGVFFMGLSALGGRNTLTALMQDLANPAEWDQLSGWMQQNVMLLGAVAGVLGVAALAQLVLYCVATGGIAHLVNEAEEGRPVRGRDGWRTGFRACFRVLAVNIVPTVPFALLIGLAFVGPFVPILGASTTATEPGAEMVMVVCGGLILALLIGFVGGSVLLVLVALATMHTVIDGTGVFRSLGAAWSDIRARFKDIFVMFLLLFVVGIGFMMVSGAVMMISGAVAIPLIAREMWPALLALDVAYMAVAIPLYTAWGLFVWAAWVIVFRKVTGREVDKPAFDPSLYAPGLPVVTPMPAPPAPPAAPAPPGPPIAPWEPQDAPPGSRE